MLSAPLSLEAQILNQSVACITSKTEAKEASEMGYLYTLLPKLARTPSKNSNLAETRAFYPEFKKIKLVSCFS